MAAEEKKKEVESQANSSIVVVRVRGLTGIRKNISDTLDMLGLYRKNYCVLIKDTPTNMGMIQKAKDYITWGIINDETLKLIDKRKEDGKKFYRLEPPKKGFGRKGIKVPFVKGGALGNRKDKINELLQRMV